MKTKLLLLIPILLCFAFNTKAQIAKGNLLLGGNISYTDQKQINQFPNNAQNYNYLYSSVQIGSAVKNNSVIGLVVSYSHNDSHAENFSDSNYYKTDGYSAGIFYRRYKNILKNFYFFGEANVLYSYSKSLQGDLQDKSDEFKTISNGGSISIIPGLSYEICKRFHVELSMPNLFTTSYVSSKLTYNASVPPNVEIHSHYFTANANLNSNLLSNLGIGFKFIL